MSTVSLLGFETSAAGLPGDLDKAFDILRASNKGCYVACTNPHSIVVARKDPLFSKALADADILLPDGIGIILGAKILGKNLSGRVAGSEFFLGLTEKAKEIGGLRYFFLGSSDEVLKNISDRISKEQPHITVCGVLSPPFKDDFSDEECAAMIQVINDAKPDVLWVGMTAPKQEKWIYTNRFKLDVKLIGAIGAVFDFYAGAKKRAPGWVCDLGLEWLPRFLREPRRLFRRNFVSSPLFLWLVIRERMFGLGGNQS